MATAKTITKRLSVFHWLLIPLLCEGLALFVAIKTGVDRFSFLAFFFHVVGAAVLFILPFIPVVRKHKDIRYYLFLSAWLTLFLPGLGVVGCILMILFGTKIMKAQGTVSAFQGMEENRLHDEIVPEFVGDVSDFLVDEINVEPMVDIITGQDTDLKRGVVKYLQHMGTPAAIKLLKKCLTDISPEVKYYAHSALELLDSEWMKRISQARHNLAENPENQADLLMALGRTYQGYAQSGLATDEAKIHFRTLATDSFKQSFTLLPNSIEHALTLGQSCLEAKQFAEAATYFSKAMTLGGNAAEPLLGLCQVYFENGEQRKLREISRRMAHEVQQAHADPYKNSLIQFWAPPVEG